MHSAPRTQTEFTGGASPACLPAADTLQRQEHAAARAQGRGEAQTLPTPPLRSSCPHLRHDGSAELADEGELVLLCVPLHDGAAGPHLCHDAACTPEVNGGTVVPLP